jgi:hypothetical protein
VQFEEYRIDSTAVALILWWIVLGLSHMDDRRTGSGTISVGGCLVEKCLARVLGGKRCSLMPGRSLQSQLSYSWLRYGDYLINLEKLAIHAHWLMRSVVVFLAVDRTLVRPYLLLLTVHRHHRPAQQ